MHLSLVIGSADPAVHRKKGSIYFMKTPARAILGKSPISCAIAFAALVWPAHVGAANLKPVTAQAWDEYLQTASERMQQRVNSDSPFLWIDDAPDRAAKVRNGEIVVSPAGPHIPRKVPAGLIHDWIGAKLIPNASLHDALSVVRNYERYKEFYHPNVIDSKGLSSTDSEDRFSMVLMNKALFEKTALDSDYQASYVRLDDRRMYSVSKTTRIREIAGYGTPGQHTLPEDEGTGLIWRLYSVIRFEERSEGLYMEVEAMVLSRDIPAAVRVFVEPIVRRVSRDALVTALRQTERALQSAAAASAANHPQSTAVGSPR
jgi:hypothetical protein